MKQVVVDGKTLKQGEDYTVSYGSNRSVGMAKVTAKGKGAYYGKASALFAINPQGTNLAKLASVGARGFTVKWGKQSKKMSTSRITGYQVQIAAKNTKRLVTVKGYAKTSCKVSNLKRLTKYQVRVCTYKKVFGKTYYSPWSNPKTVTTKR